MRYSSKRWGSSLTRSLWLISHLIILKNAVAAIAGSPVSPSTFFVNFSIPQNCVHSSILRYPNRTVIAKFERTHNLYKGLTPEAGCDDLSDDTGCYLSGNVSVSGIYRLEPLNSEEKFQTCNRSFHVPATTTTGQSSTTSLTTPLPVTSTPITIGMTFPFTSTTVKQTTTPSLHLTSTILTQTRVPSLRVRSTTSTQTKALALTSKPYEVVATDQTTETGKKTLPMYVTILISVISFVACILAIIVIVQCLRNKYKPNTGNEHGGIPAQAENLEYIERESTGTYAEIEPPQPEYDYVISAPVNHISDAMDSHCATSASNVYLTPIGEIHNPQLTEYEMVEHTELDNYEKLQQNVDTYNQYEIPGQTSNSTLDEKMRRSRRGGNDADGGYLDMESSLRDSVEDDYLKPLSIDSFPNDNILN